MVGGQLQRGCFESGSRLFQGPNVQEENLKKLHQLLIEPIADLLPRDPEAPVIFIPDGELFFVPFAALQAPDGRYLIERHALSLAPSIQTLQLIANRRPRTPSGPALVVGNPSVPPILTLNDEPPDPLPNAEREAQTVAQRLGSTPLLGDAASETAVRAQIEQASRLHFATHGFLGQRPEDRSPGILMLAADPLPDRDPETITDYLLEGDPRADGLLTATEIYDLELSADLAVLSACQTGRGQISSDSIIGLSRAFFQAGVPSVVVSLWNVDDRATADLMTAFYNHLDSHPNTATALRQAILDTQAQYPDQPELWAAFALLGQR